MSIILKANNFSEYWRSFSIIRKRQLAGRLLVSLCAILLLSGCKPGSEPSHDVNTCDAEMILTSTDAGSSTDVKVTLSFGGADLRLSGDDKLTAAGTLPSGVDIPEQRLTEVRPGGNSVYYTTTFGNAEGGTEYAITFDRRPGRPDVYPISTVTLPNAINPSTNAPPSGNAFMDGDTIQLT